MSFSCNPGLPWPWAAGEASLGLPPTPCLQRCRDPAEQEVLCHLSPGPLSCPWQARGCRVQRGVGSSVLRVQPPSEASWPQQGGAHRLSTLLLRTNHLLPLRGDTLHGHFTSGCPPDLGTQASPSAPAPLKPQPRDSVRTRTVAADLPSSSPAPFTRSPRRLSAAIGQPPVSEPASALLACSRCRELL